MSKFKITITEILSREIELEAENKDEAKEIVENKWSEGEIILTADDFKGVVFD